MKILFLIPYPLKEAPSQRFRFEQYFALLKDKNHQLVIQSFLNSHNGEIFFKSGKGLLKVVALISGFLRRLGVLLTASRYDYVFIHREAAPVGPPLIEWILAVVLRKKIIYDFDDSIWLTDKVNEGKLEKILRCRGKVKHICRWAYKVSCGNDYLCAYAKNFNRNVVLNPTTIDTEHLHNPTFYPSNGDKNITIGWTGSHSTLKYLSPIVPVIQHLEKKYPQIKFLIIANQKPDLNIRSLEFVPWSLRTEIKDLNRIDIGLMPLPDDLWAKGKCGFKLLQYMALEKPSLASPVGVNSQIIEENKNGFLCTTETEWIEKIEMLIVDHNLRSSLGREGRITVEKNYSVQSNSVNFLLLFE